MRLFLTVVGGADRAQKEVDFRLVKDDRALRIGLDIVLHLAQQSPPQRHYIPNRRYRDNRDIR